MHDYYDHVEALNDTHRAIHVALWLGLIDLAASLRSERQRIVEVINDYPIWERN